MSPAQRWGVAAWSWQDVLWSRSTSRECRGFCSGSNGENHQGLTFFFFFLSYYPLLLLSNLLTKCHPAPLLLLLERDCRGIFFELNFQTLPSYPFTFYISLLEIGNLNLFSALGFFFFFLFCVLFFGFVFLHFLPYIAWAFDACF